MAVLVARPVGVCRIRFLGINPCKNPDYFNALFGLEYDIQGQFKPEKHLHSSEDGHIFAGLQPNQDYLIRAAVGINSANEKDGKTYPARLNLRALEVVKQLTQAAA